MRNKTRQEEASSEPVGEMEYSWRVVVARNGCGEGKGGWAFRAPRAGNWSRWPSNMAMDPSSHAVLRVLCIPVSICTKPPIFALGCRVGIGAQRTAAGALLVRVRCDTLTAPQKAPRQDRVLMLSLPICPSTRSCTQRGTCLRLGTFRSPVGTSPA